MRIESAIQTASVVPGSLPRSGSTSVREVEPQRTRASMPEMKGAISRAYQSLYGKPPSKPMLDTLTAQAALETASGEKMYNFNFGGIKGASPTGETARYGTREVINGESVHIKDGFRAYRSLEDGARDFVSLLSRRYAPALEKADRGDVVGYAESLRQHGYYTAPVSEYASGLTRLVGELGGTVASPSKVEAAPVAPGATSTGDLPTVLALHRFMDALAAPIATLAAPLEDEERG